MTTLSTKAVASDLDPLTVLPTKSFVLSEPESSKYIGCLNSESDG